MLLQNNSRQSIVKSSIFVCVRVCTCVYVCVRACVVCHVKARGLPPGFAGAVYLAFWTGSLSELEFTKQVRLAV